MDWPPETSAIEVMELKVQTPKSFHCSWKNAKNMDSIHSMSRKIPVATFITGKIAHDLEAWYTDIHSIWAAIKREALYVAAEGVATPEEIDEIYKDVLKTPKGPFEQMDTVGLDVVKDIEENYAKNRKALPQEPRDLLARMIQEGKLGVKTGEGFYKYWTNFDLWTLKLVPLDIVHFEGIRSWLLYSTISFPSRFKPSVRRRSRSCSCRIKHWIFLPKSCSGTSTQTNAIAI
jgi:hypothetical protein